MTEWSVTLRINAIGPTSSTERMWLPPRLKQKRKKHTPSRKILSSECAACSRTRMHKGKQHTRNRFRWRTNAWPRRRETVRPPGEMTRSLQTRLKQLSQTTMRFSKWMEQSAELTTTNERPDDFFEDKWPSWPHLTHNKHFLPLYYANSSSIVMQANSNKQEC